MSTAAPPFPNYRAVFDRETWAQILAGDVAAFVYSSEAEGDFEPVPISAAQFFVADQASRQDNDYGHDTQLQPFQIMVRDRDDCRSVAARRRIPVPHWVYVLKTAVTVTGRSGPGAVDLYDWDEIDQVIADLWRELGDFMLPDNHRIDWKSQNSVIERVKDYLQKHGREIPGDTQLKKRVGQKIKKLRRPE